MTRVGGSESELLPYWIQKWSPDSSKISHFTAKICRISRTQATILSKTNHYAKPLRITMDSTSTFVHMQLTWDLFLTKYHILLQKIALSAAHRQQFYPKLTTMQNPYESGWTSPAHAFTCYYCYNFFHICPSHGCATPAQHHGATPKLHHTSGTPAGLTPAREPRTPRFNITCAKHW